MGHDRAMTDLSLTARTGLPDALRVLLDELPRDRWEAHRAFHGLVSFWLDRHLMFRRLMEAMAHDTEAMLDKRIDPQRFAGAVSRHGGIFLQNLHGHHQIEDTQYFPRLRLIDPRLERGFDLLDADHHALDVVLARFADTANAVIRGVQDGDAMAGAQRFRRELLATRKLIDRHLVDEEDLIVPVILGHGFDG